MTEQIFLDFVEGRESTDHPWLRNDGKVLLFNREDYAVANHQRIPERYPGENIIDIPLIWRMSENCYFIHGCNNYFSDAYQVELISALRNTDNPIILTSGTHIFCPIGHYGLFGLINSSPPDELIMECLNEPLLEPFRRASEEFRWFNNYYRKQIKGSARSALEGLQRRLERAQRNLNYVRVIISLEVFDDELRKIMNEQVDREVKDSGIGYHLLVGV